MLCRDKLTTLPDGSTKRGTQVIAACGECSSSSAEQWQRRWPCRVCSWRPRLAAPAHAAEPAHSPQHPAALPQRNKKHRNNNAHLIVNGNKTITTTTTTITTITKKGIYVSDILEAVPLDKFFMLYRPGAGGEGGFIRLGLDYSTEAPQLARGERQGGRGRGREGERGLRRSGDWVPLGGRRRRCCCCCWGARVALLREGTGGGGAGAPARLKLSPPGLCG